MPEVLVPPVRLARWVENFAARHGSSALHVAEGRLTGTADDRGTLTPGKLADFIAVDTDITDPAILTDEPLRIRNTQVLQSVVGGETRWEQD